jgi:hypothetical protein
MIVCRKIADTQRENNSLFPGRCQPENREQPVLAQRAVQNPSVRLNFCTGVWRGVKAQIIKAMRTIRPARVAY